MSIAPVKPWPQMTGRDEFRFLADLVLKRSSADQTVVNLHDQHSGTTRFASSRIIQNVDTRRGTLTVTVAFDGHRGSASTTDFSAGSVQDTLARAERIAECLPRIRNICRPRIRKSFRRSKRAGRRRPRRVPPGVWNMRTKPSDSAVLKILKPPVLSPLLSRRWVSPPATACLHRKSVRRRVSVSPCKPKMPPVGARRLTARSIICRIQDRTLTAINKAKRSRDVQGAAPGRYRVILEPAAVAGLWSWMLWTLDAKSYEKGTSPFADQLGRQILDERLTLQNLPGHPDLLGTGFTHEGLPSEDAVWIEKGVLKQLAYDRFTAKQQRIKRIATLEAPCLSASGPTALKTQELIKQCERAILVTNFWYIRTVNPTDLTLTGMTRDGTFLVEDGQITSAVRNFRFHESPLRVFKHVDACTEPAGSRHLRNGQNVGASRHPPGLPFFKRHQILRNHE